MLEGAPYSWFIIASSWHEAPVPSKLVEIGITMFICATSTTACSFGVRSFHPSFFHNVSSIALDGFCGAASKLMRSMNFSWVRRHTTQSVGHFWTHNLLNTALKHRNVAILSWSIEVAITPLGLRILDSQSHTELLISGYNNLCFMILTMSTWRNLLLLSSLHHSNLHHESLYRLLSYLSIRLLCQHSELYIVHFQCPWRSWL